ncbi:hypothetical protein HK099_008438, partial [Clydaea vesicula]
TLASNNLTGNIPAELNNLNLLESLDLSGNNFTGTIANFINFNNSLVECELLNVGNVCLDSNSYLPSICLLEDVPVCPTVNTTTSTTATQASPTDTPSSTINEAANQNNIIIASISSILIALVLIIGLLIFYLKLKKTEEKNTRSMSSSSDSIDLSHYTTSLSRPISKVELERLSLNISLDKSLNFEKEMVALEKYYNEVEICNSAESFNPSTTGSSVVIGSVSGLAKRRGSVFDNI